MFEKGKSGNLGGRPRDGEAAAFMAELRARRPRALAILFDKMERGEDAALALYFRLSTPPLKPESQPTEVQAKRGATTADRLENLLKMALSGEISATVAGELMDVAAQHAMLNDLKDLKQMLVEWREQRKAQ